MEKRERVRVSEGEWGAKGRSESVDKGEKNIKNERGDAPEAEVQLVGRVR